MYQERAQIYADNGFDTTPVRGKAAILTGWADRPASAREFDKYEGYNLGVVLGGQHNLIAVDIDVTNEECAKQIEKLAEDILGFAPSRVGNAPKSLLVFRSEQPRTKKRSGVYEIDGKDCGVEILAEGQQFVAAGTHPDTKKPYRWPKDKLSEVKVTDLTVVSDAAIDEFMDAAVVVMGNYGNLKGRSQERAPTKLSGLNFKELRAKIDEVNLALAHLPNDDEHYDTWVQTLHAIKGALGEDGYELAHTWSQRSRKYDENETDRAWRSIKDVRNIGAGSIFRWAEAYGFDLREIREPARPTAITKQVAEGEAAFPILRASEIQGPVAEREWLLDQWFPARAVSMLFGQGGVGKSLLAHQLANCVADGREFLGIQTRAMPVLAVFCEDDADEIKRRQLSINEWLGVNDITSRASDDLYIWPRVGGENGLVTFPADGEDQAGEFFNDICNEITRIKDDAGSDEIFIILDTAADMFQGNENIRRQVNTFIKTYCGSLCVNYKASVLVLAHPSLSGMSSGSGLSGSTAWENSARARAYLSKEDDDMDDVRTLSRKKSNYSASGAQTDVNIIWDQGCFHLPTSPDHIDKLEKRALKNKIVEAVKQAWDEGNPFKQKSGRKLLEALPVLLNERRRVVQIAVKDLEISGAILLERKGYRISG